MTTFAAAYDALTPAQKKAVDTVEGPVLVIAGPGTGKTHILTLRVANILQKTQATPGNILVLTFTESAARTIRKRLHSLIGEVPARDIFISTFHSFAEHLLSQYQESFTHAIGKRLAGEVESTLLWREVLEHEELVHLKTTKSPYFYLKDLARLRDDLMRERISLSDYRAWADTEAGLVNKDESLHYVRGERQGELKPEGQKKRERFEKAHEAARLMKAYEDLKEKRGMYDFADVLRIAVDGLLEDADLRATIQEQYQYILADEHQDANALQHQLLDLLAYDEHPNIFVVGDEKQAIYRFQGADSSHFKTFTEHFPRTEIVYLTESYRSRQELLTHAHTLIQGVPAALGEHVALTAVREGEAQVRVLAAADPLGERDQVATLIEQALSSGTAPHDIAIIAARNSTADVFAEHLEAREIPVLRAGDVLLSRRPTLRFILALMRAVANPLNTASLREALLAPWWPLPLSGRAHLLLKHRDPELWNALETTYPDIARCIRALQEEALSAAPLALLSKLLTQTGARGYLLSHAEHLDDVLLLRKVIMHIEEIVARDPNHSFTDVVEAFTKAHEHGLESVKSSVTLREGLVTVITAHKAKGMEFTKVFLVGATAREWEKGGLSPKIPSPIDAKRSLADITKLFYVAMTRAKDDLTISYSQETGEGRDTPPSALIPTGLPEITIPSNPLPRMHQALSASLLVCELVSRYLEEEGLSPSAFNEYLESPAVFFARRVLRLHEPETPATTIGSAVHAGIAMYLETKDEGKARAELSRCLAHSLLPRTTAFERVVTHATQSLNAYIAYAASKHTEVVAIEKRYTLTTHHEGKDVLLQGKVDAIFKESEGESIVDFKTSSNIQIKEATHMRQLAFYDFLLRAEGHAPHNARIIQVTPEGVKEYPILLTEAAREEFKSTLAEVLHELISCTWRTGEASEYDDVLKLFTE